MSKTYTLIAKSNFSGKKTIKIGDEIKELTAEQVARFLKKDSGEFANKKDQDVFVEEYEAEVKAKLENEAKAKALLEKEKLENDLNLSIQDVVMKRAALNGKVLSESETLAEIEVLLKVVKK